MKFAKLVMIPIIAITLAYCTSKPANFYILTPTYEGKIGKSQAKTINVGVGSINLAKYLDMPQIVTRDSQHQVFIDEYHRWSSPLHDNILSVISQNLTYLLPNANIFEYPWRSILRMGYQVEATIWRMDVDQYGTSVLKINWAIYAEGGTKLILNTTSTYHSRIPLPLSYKIYAIDVSNKLGMFSRDVAKTLKRACSDLPDS